MFKPSMLGAPAAFRRWRPQQEDAILRFDDWEHSTALVVAPTGTGKTLMAWAFGAMSGMRTLILTATRSLQTEYEEKLEEAGLVDIRGQANYPCRAVAPSGHLRQYRAFGETVEDGPCHHGIQCPLVADGCDFYDQVRSAAIAQYVVSNYAFWCGIGKNLRSGRLKEDPLGQFDLIVCDEAHYAEREVCRALAVKLDLGAVRALLGIRTPHDGAAASDWQKWATAATEYIKAMTAEVRGDIARFGLTEQSVAQQRSIKSLREAIEQIGQVDDGWTITRADNTSTVTFEPVWPKEHCEDLLFRGAERRVLLSATMQLEGVVALGLDPDEVDFIEYDSDFPVARRPIYVIDMHPRIPVNHRMTESSERTLIARMDAAMRPRLALGRNGLIQTVSYARTRSLVELSRCSAGIITNLSKESGPTWLRKRTPQAELTKAALAEFRASRGKVLAGPSFVAGEDFPDDECRWIFAMKLPFIDTSSPVMRRRKEEDPGYADYMMMQNLVQSFGRAMRSRTDWFEGMIFDGNALWALSSRHQRSLLRYAPLWFRRSLRFVQQIPAPLMVAA